MNKYDVILIDPPWQFRVWSEETGHGRSAESYYRTMNIEDLCRLPIQNIAADNCALFIWTVWPSIFEYIPPLLKAWDFEYKTKAFSWWKLNKQWHKHLAPLMMSYSDYPLLEKLFFMGMGYYARANSEPCLLAVKGHMPVSDRGVRNFIIAPIREHSQKPVEQYSKIEALYPDQRYVELFARATRKGWDSIGNEIDGRDIFKVLGE